MGEEMRRDVINTSVIPLVGVVSSREQEIGRVIDSWQGVVLSSTGGSKEQLEGSSLVLWFSRTCDGEVRAHEDLHQPLLGLGVSIHSRQGDVWLSCGQRGEMIG